MGKGDTQAGKGGERLQEGPQIIHKHRHIHSVHARGRQRRVVQRRAPAVPNRAAHNPKHLLNARYLGLDAQISKQVPWSWAIKAVSILSSAIGGTIRGGMAPAHMQKFMLKVSAVVNTVQPGQLFSTCLIVWLYKLAFFSDIGSQSLELRANHSRGRMPHNGKVML